MRDRRSEGPFGRPLGIDVDPLRVVGRRRERVDALLRDVEPRRRAELASDEVARSRSRRRLHSGPKPRERRVATEQLEALVEARRDARAGHGDADRQVDGARLLAELVAELLQRALDRVGRPRIDPVERLGRRAQDRARRGAPGPARRRGTGTRRSPGTRRSGRSSPARSARRRERAPRASRCPCSRR